MDEIVNKVAKSGLITIDLAEFKPLDLVELDIASQLWEGMVLKETDFRDWVKMHDWSSYQNKNVCVFCSGVPYLHCQGLSLCRSSFALGWLEETE